MDAHVAFIYNGIFVKTCLTLCDHMDWSTAGLCDPHYLLEFGEYYSTIKRWDIAIYDNLHGPWAYYAKWSKSDRERQMVYFTHIGNIKKIYKINEETKPDKNQQVGTENKIVVTKGVGVG